MGITQEVMAEKLGIIRKTYASYEEYRAEPNISLLVKMSNLFEISIDDLIKNEL